MRVIAGTHRGRVLRGPTGAGTRPITDRVKESLFDILGGRVAGATVADCFCGTGSLGIEALSRGAAFVTFAETHGPTLRLLKENLESLGLASRAAVVRHDVLRKGLPAPAPPAGAYSLVFLDPPYAASERSADRLWSRLCESADAGLVAADGVVVWRHEARMEVAVPAEAAVRWRIDDRRRYGTQALAFIVPVVPTGAPETPGPEPQVPEG